jgi:hypothetical protein
MIASKNQQYRTLENDWLLGKQFVLSIFGIATNLTSEPEEPEKHTTLIVEIYKIFVKN